MTKNNITFQFVPPYTHHANIAEYAIQTFKSHLKSAFAFAYPDFPLSEWDHLLDQDFITLNLLCGSWIIPKLSVYAYLFSQFNFNTTPLVPPGTKIVIQSKPGQRNSWD